MNDKKGVVVSHHVRMVKCAYPGCEVRVPCGSPRGKIYCDEHKCIRRQETYARYEQRRKERRNGNGKERGRPAKSKPLVFRDTWSPCDNCEFLDVCRDIVNQRIDDSTATPIVVDQPYCYVESSGHEKYLKVYGGEPES